jgi:hypothetical protein
MSSVQAYFLESYDESRSRFRQQLVRLQPRWPLAALGRYSVAGDDATTIDWIEAPSTGRWTKCLVVTTGLHGAEGLAGTAALQRLIDHWLPEIDPSTCGLLLIHAVNPWGMRHFRRVNPHNIDLNRNFLDFSDTLPANDDYRLLHDFLAPQQPVGSPWFENPTFVASALRMILEYGFDRVKAATLLGQYEFPHGLYFGGQSLQEETETILALLHSQLERYQHILHLDMHTGFGPRGRATLVISPVEERPSTQLRDVYNYPLISRTDPDEFYAIQGDMIDYFSRLAATGHPKQAYIGMAIEFGTMGDRLPALVASLQATILENRLYHHSAQSEATQSWVERRYRSLFYPSDPSWRTQMMTDTDLALEGVLRAEGYVA